MLQLLDDALQLARVRRRAARRRRAASDRERVVERPRDAAVEPARGGRVRPRRDHQLAAAAVGLDVAQQVRASVAGMPPAPGARALSTLVEELVGQLVTRRKRGADEMASQLNCIVKRPARDTLTSDDFIVFHSFTYQSPLHCTNHRIRVGDLPDHVASVLRHYYLLAQDERGDRAPMRDCFGAFIVNVSDKNVDQLVPAITAEFELQEPCPDEEDEEAFVEWQAQVGALEQEIIDYVADLEFINVECVRSAPGSALCVTHKLAIFAYLQFDG